LSAPNSVERSNTPQGQAIRHSKEGTACPFVLI
jgi:hypothetical protein